MSCFGIRPFIGMFSHAIYETPFKHETVAFLTICERREGAL